MERLTNSTKNIFEGKYMNINKQQIYSKLFLLENLEEELGIDLITLFKALKEGIWYKFKNDDIQYISDTYLSLDFYFDHFAFWANTYSRFDCKHIGLKDYGKTWSLDRSELENE